MGKVIAQIKVMPEDADTDLDALEEGLEEALPESAELSAIEREDVAFGLVALMVKCRRRGRGRWNRRGRGSVRRRRERRERKRRGRRTRL